MKLRKIIIKVLSILLLFAAGMESLYIHADGSCLDSVCVDLPSIISGNVVDDIYYSGQIEVASNFTTQDILEEFIGEYTIDNGESWHSASVTNNVALDFPLWRQTPGPIIFWGGTEISFAARDDGGFVSVWSTENGVFARRYDHVGNVIRNINITSDPSGDDMALGSTVISLPNDGFVVSWVERSSYSIPKLYYKVFNSNDELVYGGRLGLSKPGDGYLRGYQIAPLADGFMFTVGMAPSQWDFSQINLVAFRVGQSSMSGAELYRNTIPDMKSLLMHPMPDGKVLSFYSSGKPAKTILNVFSKEGVLIREGVDIGTDGVAKDIASDESGNYLIAFWHSGTAAITAALFSSDGIMIGAPFSIEESGVCTTRVGNLGGARYLVSVYHCSDIGETLDVRKRLNVYRVDIESNGGKNISQLMSTVDYNGSFVPVSVDAITKRDLIFRTSQTIKFVPYIKTVSKVLINPATDIDVRFKLEDGDYNEWYSSLRSYKYANTNDGVNGSINYNGGYGKSSSVPVEVVPSGECETCTSFQLYQRSTQVQDNLCQSFPSETDGGGWTTYGYPYHSPPAVSMPVENNRCYQYKVQVTNLAGNAFEYINPNVVQVDQVAPTIDVVSEQTTWDKATLNLAVNDDGSGVDKASYRVNDGEAVSFTGSSLTATLAPGVNHIAIDVTDRAGNAGTQDYYTFFDNTPADIVIHSIEDGGTYGDDLTLDFSLTQDLTDLQIIVDGEPRSDLVGLSDGVHTVTIKGYDAHGQLVESTVTFTKDSSIFSLSILSPQNRIYDINTIQVDYTSSREVSDAWYSLAGGTTSRQMTLTNLADGNHQLVLYVKASTGEVKSKMVSFTVKKGVPLLEVSSPVEGRVYLDNTVSVDFSSDSPVTYQVVNKDGSLPEAAPITSGTKISLESSGSYSLILTATHESGNQLSKIINFTTDSVAPEITLNSPQAHLYTFDSIPIKYNTNKTLTEVEYYLDGKKVSALTGLSAGAHTFMIQGKDAAGRTAQQLVRFNAATLEIQSPQEGETVISNSMPPHLPFRYDASAGFSSYSVSVDAGTKQLLVDPPGSTIPLTMSPGEHEVTLQGQIYGLSSAKRANFTIGAMNVSAGTGSIDYSYTNCDTASLMCDVTVSIKITNDGYYDINEPITLRFDHVAESGYQTQLQTISGLAVGQTQSVELSPFQARLGDTFSLVVDPYHEITGEWSADNAYSLAFQTGQITAVSQELAQNNVYLEGVTIFNPLKVETAGAVSSVQVVVNGWTFVDNDKSDGFSLLADMGLLTSENSCLEVIARIADTVALDSQRLCFDVRPLEPASTAKYIFPWEFFSQGNGIVNVSSLSRKDVAATLSSIRFNALQQPASVIPILEEDGLVTYKFLSDPAATQGQPYTTEVDMGSPVLGGVTGLPGGHGLYVATLDPSHGACEATSAIPIMDRPTYGDLSALYQAELAEVNKLANYTPDDVEDETDGLDFLQQWSGGGLFNPHINTFYYATHDTTYDFWVLGIMHGYESQLATVTVSTPYRYGFESVGCFIPDNPSGVYLSYDGKFDVNINVNATISLNAQHDSLVGLAVGHYGPIPLVGPVVGGIRLYPANVNFVSSLDFSARVEILDGHFYVGPFSTSFDAYTHFNGKLAEADLVFYPLIVLGGGQEIEYRLYMDGLGKADVVGGNQSGSSSFISQSFVYSRAMGYLNKRTRNKYCLLTACYHTSWEDDYQDLYGNDIDELPTEHTETGTKYEHEQVDNALAEIEPVDVLAINDLTALGLYSLVVGDTQLAQEYLSCGALQSLEASDMPFAPLFSNKSGVCAPVTDPDYEDVNGAMYYTDATCQQEIDYKPISFLNYCQNNLLSPTNTTYVGNATAWPDEESNNPAYPGIGKSSKWTLSHGPTLNALAVSPRDNSRPFMKQVEYRTVDNCHLEMRVYKKKLTDTNLKPLMLIHGGAWKYRGFGAVGAEALVSQFTEEGFIVFQPYYRLMGSSDGPTECQIPAPTTSTEPVPGELIVQDIDAALDWVNDHGATLGSAGGQVTLVGQSAGAHLAGWLSTHRSAEIAKNLLIYTPTDFEYYINQILDGVYGYPPQQEGKVIMDELLGADISTMVKYNLPPFVYENSFPEYVNRGGEFPPSFMIHGNADTLVPVDMSIRMCNALAGTPGAPPYDTAGGRYVCGTSRGVQNTMHIIDGANHMLDLKCFVDTSNGIGEVLLNNFKELSNLCPAGSLATSENVVRPALEEGINWLAN